MFAGVPPEDRLDPTDAQFVDVLHTDMNCKYNTFVADNIQKNLKKDLLFVYIIYYSPIKLDNIYIF